MTDIAIIIVAADDNVMPQTVEAINHASAAGVPIVFAINKIDKPNANPDKIKEELANMNYLVEDWGGKYQSQEISAKKGTGVHELMEKVLLEAELLDLKANPNRRATGSSLLWIKGVDMLLPYWCKTGLCIKAMSCWREPITER